MKDSASLRATWKMPVRVVTETIPINEQIGDYLLSEKFILGSYLQVVR